ncbi:hypothetical protein [Phenylobacterium sp.]|uniref:hypothetical protein n=1 Tax=Phenylobacterium sp. TaxID=1871053 RepID=UPI002727154D|nr:hypothetical protein [Phenylobacterium sp.]MDO8801954.1 hypothetical protein [Phenylobacterium sp.]
MEHPLSAPRHWLAGAAIISSLGVFAPCAHAQDIPAQAAASPQRNEFVSAIGQPLADFNINQAEIHDSLRKAAHGPYAALAGCAAMASEIAGLDEALGPDLDVAALKTTKRRMASRAAAGAIRRLSVSWIPMRGVVRTVTGAEAHARKVQDAALAGAVRRAYLKGLGERDGCAGAMPRRALVELEIIETEQLAIPALDAPTQVVALDTP